MALEMQRYKLAKKITLLGALVNAILGSVKLIGGIIFHSHALAADGVHSFADLLTDVMVLFASKYGSQAADETHPYGHQRIETAATLLLAVLLIFTGIGIAWDSINEIIHHTHTPPQLLALPLAIFSILANEGLFHYTHHIGKRIRSDLIIANAWHHRSDAASSIVVLIGLIASLAGWIYFDAVAAVIVGFMIVQMGVTYGWNSIKELTDSAVNPTLLHQIVQSVLTVEGVKKIHQLRTRSMGKDVVIDLHILVAPNITVSEGHYIAQHVHYALTNQFEEINDVTVHVDPEDDETNPPSFHLPNRTTLEKELLLPLQLSFPHIQSWYLHFLDGKIMVDLICKDIPINASVFSEQLKNLLSAHPYIWEIRIYNEQYTIRNAVC